MVDQPDVPQPVPFQMPQVSVGGSAHAPFLFYDDATAFGHLNGIIQVTLEAVRLYPNSPKEGLSLERVVVAHLRMGVPAARALKAAIEGALLLAAPASSEAKN
jgi:hypothetical protein